MSNAHCSIKREWITSLAGCFGLIFLAVAVLGSAGCDSTQEVAGQDDWDDEAPHMVDNDDPGSSSSTDSGSTDSGSDSSTDPEAGSASSDPSTASGTADVNPVSAAGDSAVAATSDPRNSSGRIRDAKRTNPLATIPKDPKKTVNITFDDLAFEMEKGGDFERSMLTDHINQLDQRTIKVRGYIKPTNRSSGIRKFVFVRDDKECCFGPQAAIFDNILVSMKKGKELDYTVRPITLQGKLKLVEWRGPDDKIWSIYQMRSGVKK